MDSIEIIEWVCVIFFGFCLGALMFSLYIPRAFMKIDVSKLGDDHNPGAANVFKLCGWEVGLFCLFLDMLKGFLPVFSAIHLLSLDVGNFLFVIVMMSPVLGHATAIFNRVRGGKGIAVSFGVLLGLIPVSYVAFVLAGIYIFFSTAMKIHPNRKRSIVTYSLFAFISLVFSFLLHQYAIGVGCVAISCIVVCKHIKDRAEEEEEEPEKSLQH